MHAWVMLSVLSACLLFNAVVDGQAVYPECPASTRTEVDRAVIELTSDKFLRVLEPFQNTPTEIVFVLDSSGSVGKGYFGCEVQFVRHFSKFFSISPETSRIAVVTYSSCSQITTDLDYINTPTGKNKCTLLGTDLLRTVYRGGGTCTPGGLSRAEDILAGSRESAKKVVFILTDGASNEGGNVFDAAASLKGTATVFAIGLGSGISVTELNGIASSPIDEHVFLLSHLSDVEKLAVTLIGDQSDKAWDRDVSSDLCNTVCSSGHDCCDVRATCSCATQTGSYGCACQEGYTGDGNVGQCNACPRGTFKPRYGKQGCTMCPKLSTTAAEASTSLGDCSCLPGHDGSPKQEVPCTPVTCKQLSFSLSSGVISTKCGSTYQDECHVQCLDNYRPTPGTVGVVRCLESGLWSGEPLQCTRITCEVLPAPMNGNQTCDNTDWRIGTTCILTCDLGYERKGDLQRRCDLNPDQQVGQWSKQAGECKAKTCPVLLTDLHLNITPIACKEHTPSRPLEYTMRCFYGCDPGFELRGVDYRTCQADGTWSNATVENTCVDIAPPVFTACPADMSLVTDPNQRFANVTLEQPSATDNAGVPVIVPSASATQERYDLNDDVMITYTARDDMGLESTCTFRITVQDREPPTLIRCPHDIEEQSSVRQLVVNWTEPDFKDNSGETVQLISNSRPGAEFFWGIAELVWYRAEDQAGNMAYCNFTVAVRQYDCPFQLPPLNGALACEQWLGGQFCRVACSEDFDFNREPEDIYYCRTPPGSDDVHWAPWPFFGGSDVMKTLWPDCTAQKDPTVRIGMELQYYTGKCGQMDGAATAEIAQNFVSRFQALNLLVPGFCNVDTGCSVENVEVSCGMTGRRRRRETNMVLRLRFTVVVQAAGLQPQNESSVAGAGQPPSTIQILDNVLNELEAVVSAGHLSLEGPDGNSLSPAGPASVYRPLTLSCPDGQVLRNQSCVACPAGTYHDVEGDLCRDCDVGFYQDIEGQMACLRCPDGTTTRRANSRYPEDCKAPCPRGTFSASGLVTCVACPRGTYQPDAGATSCIGCSEGLTTWTEGALTEDECSGECPIGTYSDTGYTPCWPCPKGTYGPSRAQTSCIACPDGLYTHYVRAHDVGYCQDINECAESQPCRNGALCVNLPLGYRCQCELGFTGPDCGEDIDDCDHSLCLNGGTCVDRVAGYSCECPAGFEGEHCQINIDECQSNPCRNRAVCMDGISSYSCECAQGFTGALCEINFYDCASDPCQNEGTCVDLAENFTCCCRPGYRGRHCEFLVDHCQSVTCMNDATCVAGLNSATCICPPGFKGQRCEVDVDECELQQVVCQHGGTCVDLVDGFRCSCSAGYDGTNCESALSGDFDLQFPTAQTSDYVLVHDALPRLHALTVTFWMRSTDRANAGTPVSYAALEPDGAVQDNAFTVTDYNSLAIVLNGKFKYTDAELSDANWHHVAITWASLDGRWALYVDGSLHSSGEGFMTGAFIRGEGTLVLGQEQDSFGGSFTQTQAFVGDLSQVNMWDYAMTEDEVRVVYSSCAASGNAFAWSQVASGIHGDVVLVRSSQLCPGITDCQPSTCRNSATCTDLVGSFQCHCAFGFYGTNCELSTSSCTSETCLNGGSCHSNGSSIFCSCEIGYSGERCDVRSNACQSVMCLNGGACFHDNSVPRCNCASGFTGRFCEYDVNECDFGNGGCSHACQNTYGSFVCFCPEGFALDPDGRICNDVSYCSQNGRFHPANDVWDYKCSVCHCELGRTVCEARSCPASKCKKNEHEYQAPGACCPQCLAVRTCSVMRDGKHITYDGNRFEHRGNCRYVLSQDCVGSQFTVEVKYEATKKKIKKWALWLRLDCVEVEVDFEGVVKVTGVPVELPYLHAEPTNVLVTRTNSSGEEDTGISILTNRGVTVRWTRTGTIKVSAPAAFAGQLCGLCGNRNGNRKDDRTTRQALPARSAREFAHSWKVDGYRYCATPKSRSASRLAFGAISNDKIAACAGISFSFLKDVRRKCSSIRQRSFQMCHAVVDPTRYFEWCLQDACTCRSNEPCHCEAIAAYIYECQRRNILIAWTPNNACNIRCPEGMLYDHCGPACVPTCDNPITGGPMCQTRSCTPRCQCPAGTVMHENTCILPAYCPK